MSLVMRMVVAPGASTYVFDPPLESGDVRLSEAKVVFDTKNGGVACWEVFSDEKALPADAEAVFVIRLYQKKGTPAGLPAALDQIIPTKEEGEREDHDRED